jgi:hypothetical protein
VGERAAAREARLDATVPPDAPAKHAPPRREAALASEATRPAAGSWDGALERFRRECASTLAASSSREYLNAIARAVRETRAPSEAGLAARLDAITARLLRRRASDPPGRRAMTTSALRKLVRFLAAEGTLAPDEAACAEERLRRYRAG